MFILNYIFTDIDSGLLGMSLQLGYCKSGLVYVTTCWSIETDDVCYNT